MHLTSQRASNLHPSSYTMFSALLLVVLSSAFARADETNHTAPSPRKDSCSFIDQGKLYVLGGSTGTNIPPTPDFSIPKDSFYSLDLSVRVNATSATMTGWKTVTMEGATPVSGHTCVLLPIRVLLVFGTGMKTSSPFLQAFDLKTQRWMPPPQTRFSGNNSSSIDNELSGLYGHTSGLVGHYVVITGGKRDFPANGSSTSRTRTLSPDETTSEPNLDTFVLDVSVGPYWTWTRYPGITSIDGLTPSGRMFATSWVVGGKGDQLPTFYITGGLPVATDDTSNNDVVAPDFDGKSIWKFDPVTGFWEKDLRRTLDVLAVGMTAAVRPGTSTVYFQGGQNPIDGTFITSLRTFDFDESSNGVARIVSGFAKPAAGVSRHVSNFISSTTLAVFGGIANLNSASNEIRFLSVDPPLVASIFDPRATATPKPTTTPDSPPSDSPESEMDSKIVLIAVTTLSLLMLFSMIFLVWATWDRIVDSCTPGARRGGKLPREKAYFDLENGESTQKLLGNAKTHLEKPAGTADKALPEIPLPTRFAPSALPAVREIIEPSHLYHSVGDSSKWSYPPLPHTAATNRTSTQSSNYTDDIESLMWLENRRSSIRRYWSGRRSSASSDMSDESSAFRSSASYSESAGSRLSRNFQIPASSNIKWTFSEAYVPVPVGDEFTDNASENRMAGLQRPQPAYGVYYID